MNTTKNSDVASSHLRQKMIFIYSEGEEGYCRAENCFYPTISNREKEVLHLISQGLVSKEVSILLSISVHTVHSHIKNLKSKLNAKNTAEMIRMGFELDLLSKSPQFQNNTLLTA